MPSVTKLTANAESSDAKTRSLLLLGLIDCERQFLARRVLSGADETVFIGKFLSTNLYNEDWTNEIVGVIFSVFYTGDESCSVSILFSERLGTAPHKRKGH